MLKSGWTSDVLLFEGTDRTLLSLSISYKLYSTVVTPNKGQSIFWKIGSNKGISEIPLFAIFWTLGQIREFEIKFVLINFDFDKTLVNKNLTVLSLVSSYVQLLTGFLLALFWLN